MKSCWIRARASRWYPDPRARCGFVLQWLIEGHEVPSHKLPLVTDAGENHES